MRLTAPYKPRIESGNGGHTIRLVLEPPTYLLDLCHIGERADGRLGLDFCRLKMLRRAAGHAEEGRDRAAAADRGATAGLG